MVSARGGGPDDDLCGVLHELQEVVRLQQRALPRLERHIVRSCENLYNLHLAMGFVVLLSEALLYDGEASVTSRLVVMVVCMVSLFQTFSLQQSQQHVERLRQDSQESAAEEEMAARLSSRTLRGLGRSLLGSRNSEIDEEATNSKQWRKSPWLSSDRIVRAGMAIKKMGNKHAMSSPETTSRNMARSPPFAAAVAEPAIVAEPLESTEESIDLAASNVKIVGESPHSSRSSSSILSSSSLLGNADGPRRSPSMSSSSASICVVDGAVIKTEDEARAVKELRARLVDLEPELDSLALDLGDKTMVRFLRARKLNMKLAETLFREAHAWRQTKDPHQVFARMEHESWPELFQYATGGWSGFDKEGSPLFIDRVGQLDVAGLLARAKPEHFEQLCIWRIETNQRLMQESEKRTGRPQYQMCIIQDLKGLGMQHFNRNAFKFLQVSAHINDTYYPEQLKVCYVVNAPKIFSAIWGVVQRFFDPATRAKIQIFPGCPVELLREKIDPAVLPAFLGGERTTNGDPFCKEIILAGGKVPSHVPSLTHEHFE